VDKLIQDDLPTKYTYRYNGKPNKDGKLLIIPNDRTSESNNSTDGLEGIDLGAGL